MYVMPPTDDQGESKISIEPLDVANGTLIPYKVCVAAQEERKFCVLDSYLVWITDYVTVTPLAPVQYTSYIPFVIKHIEFYIPVMLESICDLSSLCEQGSVDVRSKKAEHPQVLAFLFVKWNLKIRRDH